MKRESGKEKGVKYAEITVCCRFQVSLDTSVVHNVGNLGRHGSGVGSMFVRNGLIHSTVHPVHLYNEYLMIVFRN